MKKTIALLCTGLLLLPASTLKVQAAGNYDATLQEILDSILTDDMTGAEQVEAITKYVGETYHYDGEGQTYDYVLQTGGGDCWAMTDLVVRLAKLAGMQAAYHDASRDPGPLTYSYQHICPQIFVDGIYYVPEAGFSDESPAQYYVISVGEEPYRTEKHADGTVSARTYVGFETEVVVPETLGGKTVTEIGDWAFQQWQLHGWNGAYLAYLKWEFIQPETITLPDTITKIGTGAFYQNDLQKIYLPESLCTIQEKAFYHCANLTDVYYAGTEAQWQAISIADGNDSLATATIHYQSSGMQPDQIPGDVNADGAFTLADAVALQKWLLAVPGSELSDPNAGDLCADGKLNVLDLCQMKRTLQK